MKKTQKLLHILEKHAGEKINLSNLLKELTDSPAPNRTDRRDKKKRFSRERFPVSEDDPKMILAELELLNMLDMDGKYVIPRKPFAAVAKISMSPQGMVFAHVRGSDPMSRDTFIPGMYAMGSLPGDEVLVRMTGKKRDRFEGTVIKILKRGRTLYRMKLLSERQRSLIPGLVLDTPGNITACLNTDRIPADTLSQLKPETTTIVTLTGQWIRHMGAPFMEAEFVRFEDDTDPDFSRILMKYNLEPVYPSSIQISDYPEEIDERTTTDWKQRVDLRALPTVTIDGDDSKDFDDAISLVQTKKSLWKLFVHIADVSYYVKPGSPLDKEAMQRATSVYLSNRVVPMLPPVLSENLCSLVAGKNRLAFTAEIDVHPADGKILGAKMYKSVIRVDKRLTYRTAEDELDQNRGDLPVDLQAMWKLAQAQKKTRMKAGRMDLNIPEAVWQRTNTGEIQSVSFKERLKSSMLIEEFMLSANTVTAEYLRLKHANVLYRVHEPMDESKVENLNAFFTIYNVPYELKNSDPHSLQKALQIVKDHPKRETLERIFNMLLLRSFMQANYRGASEGHWGLALRDYCHFTSPIRRYPDLVVHRELDALLTRKSHAHTKHEIDELGFHTSEQERKAMEAERDMARLRMIRFIEQKGLKNFKGFITGFRPDRVFLELESFPAEGVVHFSHLTNDSELILPDKFSVYVKKLSRPAFLGEEWNLELERIDTEEIRIYFKPVWPGQQPQSEQPGREGQRPSKGQRQLPGQQNRSGQQSQQGQRESQGQRSRSNAPKRIPGRKRHRY